MPLNADRIHRWANLIVGFHIPRQWLRRLSQKRREQLVSYISYMWYKANDNNPKRVARPKWFPKKYVWGR